MVSVPFVRATIVFELQFANRSRFLGILVNHHVFLISTSSTSTTPTLQLASCRVLGILAKSGHVSNYVGNDCTTIYLVRSYLKV